MREWMLAIAVAGCGDVERDHDDFAPRPAMTEECVEASMAWGVEFDPWSVPCWTAHERFARRGQYGTGEGRVTVPTGPSYICTAVAYQPHDSPDCDNGARLFDLYEALCPAVVSACTCEMLAGDDPDCPWPQVTLDFWGKD